MGTSAARRPRLSRASGADSREEQEHSADWGQGLGCGAHPGGSGFCFFLNNPTLFQNVDLKLVSQAAHSEGALDSGTLCLLKKTGGEDRDLLEGDLMPVLGKELDIQEALGAWGGGWVHRQVWVHSKGAVFPIAASFSELGLAPRVRCILGLGPEAGWTALSPVVTDSGTREPGVLQYDGPFTGNVTELGSILMNILGKTKSTSQLPNKPQSNPLKQWVYMEPLAGRCLVVLMGNNVAKKPHRGQGSVSPWFTCHLWRF